MLENGELHCIEKTFKLINYANSTFVVKGQSLFCGLTSFTPAFKASNSRQQEKRSLTTMRLPVKTWQTSSRESPSESCQPHLWPSSSCFLGSGPVAFRS